MAKPNTAPVKMLPHGRLRELLAKRRTVCVVGYPLSYEALAPHYHDIQKGVWSELTPASRMNPFRSDRDYQMVMKWFNWRRCGIVTSRPSSSFQTLRQLQEAFGLTVATQSVDGLIQANGIADAYELYGNVLKAKCHGQGHTFQKWPQCSSDTDFSVACEICGMPLFPDAEMFGWNSKASVRDELVENIQRAKLLIVLGTDWDLAPFDAIGGSSFSGLPVVEISPECIRFREGTSAWQVSMSDIEKEIAHSGGGEVARSSSPLGTAMQSFMRLYQ